MYTNETLKKLLKKSTKIKQQLIKAQITCNSVIYTEQNTEELNDVKAYLAYKIDLLNEMISLTSTFLAKKLNSYEEISTTLNTYTEQFNNLSNNARLKHLQQFYTRKSNNELEVL